MCPQSSRSPIGYPWEKRWRNQRKSLRWTTVSLKPKHTHLEWLRQALPIYLVSPLWLVTREHIISESASTSRSCSSGSSGATELRLSLSLTGSGDVRALCGDMAPSLPDVAWEGDVGCEVAWEARFCWAFSASRFSSAPKSVAPSSSSRRPDSRSRLSIRPRRFSSPSMYLALAGLLVP